MCLTVMQPLAEQALQLTLLDFLRDAAWRHDLKTKLNTMYSRIVYV
jgi:hypothetical protein